MSHFLNKQKRSQTWSFDIILAAIVFIIAFFLFYFLLKSEEAPAEDLRSDAELLAKELLSESSPINIITDGKINEEKLQNLLMDDYSQLKSKIRVEGDFCIYLEDQEGNIIFISQDTTGFGSSNIKISDQPCT